MIPSSRRALRPGHTIAALRPGHAIATLCLVLALGAPAFALAPPPGGDPAFRPQDDLFRFANGAWVDAAKIPADRKSTGSMPILREGAEADVKSLLEEAAAHPDDAEGRMIGDYYASLIDLAAIQRAGLAPLQAALERVDSVHNVDDLAAAMGALRGKGISVPVSVGVGADKKAPTVNAVYWGQSGLGMPDRESYLEAGPKAEGLRKAYVAYLIDLAKLAGFDNPEGAAARTLALETSLAKVQWKRADRRDAVRTYNPVPRTRWASEFPGFPWARFADAAAMPPGLSAIVAEPSYFKGFAAIAASAPAEDWRAYLRFRVLDEFAPYMGQAWREAAFRFHGERLQGLQVMPPTTRTAIEASNDALGEAIGARYVRKRFPPNAKARMQALVGHLLDAYRQGLAHLEWMTPATRTAALEKLGKLRVKIGYPDAWRGYAGLEVRRDDAVGNVMRAEAFDYAREMAEAGKAVDKRRWFMTPQTVNAYYSPGGNEIVFPAAILQPPFFDPARDDAYNYGAIGSVIGHEISHGFDDQGRRFDGAGLLRDWWTPADERAFTAKADRLVSQYDGYEPLPGRHINGRLTLGENIADLAGVSMALRAYHLSLGAHPAPAADGYTGDQRFFLGYARVWRAKSRPEWLGTLLMTDPHSPDRFRINGVVTNLDGFYRAFDLKPGDRLYKPEAERVRIW